VVYCFARYAAQQTKVHNKKALRDTGINPAFSNAYGTVFLGVGIWSNF